MGGINRQEFETMQTRTPYSQGTQYAFIWTANLLAGNKKSKKALIWSKK